MSRAPREEDGGGRREEDLPLGFRRDPSEPTAPAWLRPALVVLALLALAAIAIALVAAGGLIGDESRVLAGAPA